MPRLTPKERATIVDRYLAGESCPAIGADLGCSGAAVRQLLSRKGVSRRSNSEAHTRLPLNHQAFDILTPEAAYWCGFIAADGTIVRRSISAPEIAIVLSVRDRDHLLKFRDFLGSEHAITKVPARCSRLSYSGAKDAARFSIRSHQIADRLDNLGVKRGGLAPGLAESRDFWRGVVDGDGYIGISRGLARFQVVGREPLLAALRHYMGKAAGSKANVCQHKSIYQFHTSCGVAERIIGHLYTDASVGLERKVNAAKNILAAGQVARPSASCAESPERGSTKRTAEPLRKPRVKSRAAGCEASTHQGSRQLCLL